MFCAGVSKRVVAKVVVVFVRKDCRGGIEGGEKKCHPWRYVGRMMGIVVGEVCDGVGRSFPRLGRGG